MKSYLRQVPRALLLGILLLGLAVPPASAQNTPDRITRYDLPLFYRNARMQVILNKVLEEQGAKAPLMKPQDLSTRFDSVHHWVASFFPSEEPPKPKRLTIDSWRVIQRHERILMEKQFDRIAWAYIGNNYFMPLDTAYTRAVRARMQSRFGPPTKTLVELDYTRNLRAEEYIQFEYWFVLNDSIPLIVMDVNGPFDRGVVLAAEHSYRDVLYQLREVFLGDLVETESPAPFVDYYYNPGQRRWYRTGFDGRNFFTDPIGQPNLAAGRPQLELPDN